MNAPMPTVAPAPVLDLFHVKPLLQLPLDQVQEYWQLLYMHDLLKYRLCDIENPTWSDVREMIARHGHNLYHILDENQRIAGEFMLENLTGRAMQIHFSMSPELSRSSKIAAAKQTADQVFHLWKDAKDKNLPYVETIYGLTPVTNRAARIFNRKAGFKKIGVLPAGIRDRGQVVDAEIYVLVREV